MKKHRVLRNLLIDAALAGAALVVFALFHHVLPRQQEGRGSVRVLPCRESWHGITYREDMPGLVSAIEALRAQGLYPDTLLD